MLAWTGEVMVVARLERYRYVAFQARGLHCQKIRLRALWLSTCVNFRLHMNVLLTSNKAR